MYFKGTCDRMNRKWKSMSKCMDPDEPVHPGCCMATECMDSDEPVHPGWCMATPGHDNPPPGKEGSGRILMPAMTTTMS